jgi:acyl dehydratase
VPVNPDAAGIKGEPRRFSWTSDDCLLYALGIGAGTIDPVGFELEFTTENTAGVAQRVFPTFVVMAGFKATGGRSAMAQAGTWDPRMLVHGQQGIRLHGPLPTSGEVDLVDEITGVYDKGKGAVIASRAVATQVGESEPLFETTASAFIVGEGGFGGDRGPSAIGVEMPERAPDRQVTYRTRPDQALLYRLCGDRNPLHSDKQFSDVGGFERPILHGLCTYGFTGRALLHELCGSDPGRFESMQGRFSSPVLPGEALTVQMWLDDGAEDATRAVFRTVADDGRTVVDNGLFSRR